MKRVTIFIVALLILALACPPLHARGGHGGGRGGGHGGRSGGFRGGHGTSSAARSGGYHGWHGSTYRWHGSTYHGGYSGFYGHGGTYAFGFGSYAAYSSYGWYGGSFSSMYADPWYYYEPSYDDSYLLSPVPFYSDVTEEAPDQDVAGTHGEWVEVPGQWIEGIWVPPHDAWVPEEP